MSRWQNEVINELLPVRGNTRALSSVERTRGRRCQRDRYARRPMRHKRGWSRPLTRPKAAATERIGRYDDWRLG
jgi:hypothetical protein